jgi:hypothetical protein
MVPNSEGRQESSDYVRALIEQIGQSQRWIAERIGISERRLRYLIAGSREIDGKVVDVKLSYPEQFALECLALGGDQGVSEVKIYRHPDGHFTFRRYDLNVTEFDHGEWSDSVPNRLVGSFPVPAGTAFSMKQGEVVMLTANRGILSAEKIVLSGIGSPIDPISR